MKAGSRVRVGLATAAVVALGAGEVTPAVAAPNGADARAAASAVARVTGTGATAVDTPDRLKDGISIGKSGTMRVRLAGAVDAKRNVIGGRAVYAKSAKQTSTVVQNIGEATQILSVISGPSAPTRYQFDFSLGEGMQLVQGSNGEVVIRQAEATIGKIDAPWAIDATGAPVPTEFAVEGNSLVQTVNHQGAKYPVVADPRVTAGRYIYLTFNRSETVRVGNNSDYAALVSAACGLIPVPGAAVACGLIVGTLATQLAYTFKNAAAASGKCAQMRFNVAVLFPLAVGAYSGSSIVNC